MVGIVKEINGQKKIVPLTTDTGTGAPVGTLISQYKKVPMSGYLYCDGSTFDQNAYPALYMYLGTNVLPDYRECVMVGAEQNTTDTIATHDVYTEGEFKDDQMQRIQGTYTTGVIYGESYGIGPNTYDGAFTFATDSAYSKYAVTQIQAGGGGVGVKLDSARTTRTGDTNTTHGKQKAVYVYIKATSGLAENQQENVLNDVKGYVDGSIDKIHPTIDLSKVVSGNVLNVKALYETYGNGRYVYIAQGSKGNTSATIDIYTLNLTTKDETYWMVSANTFNGTSVVYGAFNGSISGSPTFTFNIEFSSDCRCISKACSLL